MSRTRAHFVNATELRGAPPLGRPRAYELRPRLGFLLSSLLLGCTLEQGGLLPGEAGHPQVERDAGDIDASEPSSPLDGRVLDVSQDERAADAEPLADALVTPVEASLSDAGSDAARDAGANETPSCGPANQTCRQSCSLATLGACDFSCGDRSECEQTCAGGRACNFTCHDAERCRFHCPAGALCNITCENAERCDITCEAGSTCNIRCVNASCGEVACEQALLTRASCRLECVDTEECDYPGCNDDVHCEEDDVVFCGRFALCPSG